MDAKTLADAITILLAPALPYLVSGGGELVKEAGKALGENAPEILKSLWSKLRPKVEEKPVAAEAVEEVAKAPEDADAQGALRIQLRKILESDPELAAEIAGLVKEAQAAASYNATVTGGGAVGQGTGNVVAGQGGIAVGRDVRVTK
ncbi:MAG TPA: hypothetical protein VF789_21465 [Thermoanaerobaculia bacterium]